MADRTATQKRRARQQQVIAAGLHPASGAGLLTLPGLTLTCGGCAHAQPHVRARTYWKFAKAILPPTSGPATDILLAWPACRLYTPVEASDAAS